jgi:hypothetical protein
MIWTGWDGIGVFRVIERDGQCVSDGGIRDILSIVKHLSTTSHLLSNIPESP